MSNMTLYGDGALSITVISNIFIDNYMIEANGEFVKVYLYLLRCVGDSNKKCTVSAIADALNHTEKDVIRALTYWERQNVLRLEHGEGDSITGIGFLPLHSVSTTTTVVAPTVAVTPVAAAEVAPSNLKTEVRKEYTIDEIDSFRNDPELSELFFVIEAYMRKPLTVTQINTILYWFTELSFSTDLIEYLVEYSVNKGHYSFHYMDKIALDWHSNSISTIEAAKADAECHNKANYTVLKALGISGRDLAQSEKSYIARWTEQWHFELPLIEEACRRTIDATHQPSFAYADKVLSTWKDAGVRNMEDIHKLDENFSKNRKITVHASDAPPKRTGFSNFDARNNDYDQLEQMLAQRPI